MIKILFMLSSMNIGGVEKSLLSLLSVIPKEKYDITLMVLEKKGGFLEFVPEWVKIVEASWYKEIKPVIMQPPQQTINSYLTHKKYSKIPSFVCSYLFSKHFDNRYLYYTTVLKNVPNYHETYDLAVSYQGPTDIIDFYVANKVTAKRKISWVHFDISKHIVNEKLYEKMYKKFDRLFIVSQEARERLIQKIPTIIDKSEVFLNIVSSELINQLSRNKIDFDSEYNGTKIVTVGRLSKEKGQDIAIRVLQKLRNDGIDVRWYCVGEGKDRKEYEELIEQLGLENEFNLLGAKPNPYPYIAKADVYVQPSRQEGYCLTLAEAKCLHKPIVTTNFTGAYEQIEDQRTGSIVSIDEDELYMEIKTLIKKRNKREIFSNNLSRVKIDTTTEVNKLLNYIEEIGGLNNESKDKYHRSSI